jgi:hypothetical protein
MILPWSSKQLAPGTYSSLFRRGLKQSARHVEQELTSPAEGRSTGSGDVFAALLFAVIETLTTSDRVDDLRCLSDRRVMGGIASVDIVLKSGSTIKK